MRQLGKQDKITPQKTVVTQFGEGNFLRAFADYMIDVANEQGVFDGGVAVIKPIPYGSFELFDEQDNAYTVVLRGLVNGERVVEHRIVGAITDTIDPFADYETFLNLAKDENLQFVISNTTEAGIVYDETDKFENCPANSFPGKLTQFLYARYNFFKGETSCGLIILPVELIDENGAKLKSCVLKLISLWKLDPKFADWVSETCIFCNTLVDRIVSGYPKDEADIIERDLLGYRDALLVVGEPFGIWVIAHPRHKEVREKFPLDRAGMPLVFTDDYRPYRERKVRILNGAHTSISPIGFLSGKDTVAEAMEDKRIHAFINAAIYEDIAPAMPLPITQEEITEFIERFKNPFIRHELLSISLNSVSKWKARVLQSLKDNYAKTQNLPTYLAFSLAALTTFYRLGAEREDGCLIGQRDGKSFPIRDDAHVLNFFFERISEPVETFVPAFLATQEFWGEDLNEINGMTEHIITYLDAIEKDGMYKALELVIPQEEDR